jgi:intercellular adhesion molecule 4
LDGDGAEDFLVGAPFGGADKKGVVYVYYGNLVKDKLSEQHTQLLSPSIFGQAGMEGFGSSFASGTDFDFNTVNDVAIGSFKSSHAMVVYARPVVTVFANPFKLSASIIDPKSLKNQETRNGKTYEVVTVDLAFTVAKLPAKYTNPSATNFPLEYEIKLDTERGAGLKSRAFILDNNKETATYSGKTQPKKAQKLKVYVDVENKDLFTPLAITLTWKMGDVGKCATTSPKVCPILNAAQTKQEMRITFEQGCGVDGCQPDLAVSTGFALKRGGTTQTNDIIMVGLTDIIELKVDVENKNENSFQNSLDVIYPKEVDVVKVDIVNSDSSVTWNADATSDSGVRTLKVKLSSPLYSKKTDKVVITFGLGAVTAETKDIKFNVEAKANNDINLANNKKDVSIKIELVAGLAVTGAANLDSVKWLKNANKTKTPGTEIIFTFLVSSHISGFIT